MRDFLVYLAGPITGLTFDESEEWRTQFTSLVPREIRCMSPMRAMEHFLRPKGEIIADGYQDDPNCTDDGLFLRDKNDCIRADALVVNLLGAKRVTIGTMFEMAWAHILQKPLVLIMEKTGNLHEHPFVRKATGIRVSTVEEAAEFITTVLMPDSQWTPRE